MPERPPPSPQFLTYICTRNPKYKFHKGLGLAKAAVVNAKSSAYWRKEAIKVWQWNEESKEWTLLYEIDPADKVMPWETTQS